MSNLRVLVVGGSIAGPTAAYWLARAGATVTVIERFPQLRRNGQNVDIRTSGVTVMRRMPGMEAAVRSKLVDIDGLCFLHADGRPFATMKASGNPDQQTLISEYEIYRGDLARILFDMTKDNERIRYVFGEQVASMQQPMSDGPVKVEFANGSPSSEYDLVVACDGATSRTRAIGLECGVRDHIKSINSWVAYFTLKDDLLNGSKWGMGFNAVGGRLVTIGPEGGMLMGIFPRNQQDATLPFREAQRQGTESLKTYVAQHFRGAGWRTDEILSGMMESEDFYAAELIQVKVPSLTKGRFVMVGDAGYAPGPTGTGTSLALTGAYVLAGEIAAHRGDLAAGLKGYEDRMAPIIADMQKIPPGVPNAMAPQTMLGIRIRNIVVRLVTWFMAFGNMLPSIGRLWASAFGPDKYNIPDYEWETQEAKRGA